MNQNTALGGFQIAVNNIRVCLLCFALGAVFGIGGFAVLAFNGAMVGSILAFCELHRFDRKRYSRLGGSWQVSKPARS